MTPDSERTPDTVARDLAPPTFTLVSYTPGAARGVVPAQVSQTGEYTTDES